MKRTPLDPPAPGDNVESLADAEARALLRRLPAPSPGADVRVRAALRRRLQAQRFGARSPVWVLASVGALAGAITMGVGVWWGTHLATPSAVPLAEALASDAGWESAAVASGVALTFQGTGSVSGDSLHPRIGWDRGLVNVEVTPGMGIDLHVTTREADVRVVGTGFSVERDAMGTEVKVTHGRVEVRCLEAEPVFLDPGQSKECLPTSAGGFLGRARAIEAGGARPEAVLGAVESGLGLAGPDDAAVRDELTVMAVHQLLRAGRSTEAESAAQAYLARTAAPRRLEVLRMLAASRLERSGCAGAWALLDEAARAPGADAEDVSVRDGCRARLAVE